MGNNKGRSNGCGTCLRRRVKCDQNHPICTRCSKGKFTCLGYREALFIDAREQILRRLDRGSTSRSKKETSSLEMAEKGQNFLNLAEKSVKPRHVFHFYQESHIWPSLPASALRDDIFVSYLVANSINGPMETIYRTLLAPSSQADSLQQTARKQCFLALATTFYGVGHAQESLMYDGRRLYGRALKMVNETMGDSSRTGTTEALSSVVALCLHEAIAPIRTSDHFWLQHIFGLEQLFAIHGPISEKSDPLDSALLEVTRPTMNVAALYARRPSLMARPEWRAATSCMSNDDNDSPPGSALAYLLDALAQIPALYRERDAIVAGPPTQVPDKATASAGSPYSSSRVRALLNRSLSLLGDICSQRTQWKAFHPGSDFPSLPCAHIPSTQPYPCTVVTHFSSIHVANAFTLYNALVILIHQFVTSIYQLLPVSDLNMLADELASEQILVAVMEILKSIDYHLPFTEPTATSAAGASGARNIYLLLPIRVAYKALLQSKSPKAVLWKLWLEDVFNIIKGRAGPWVSNEQIFRVRESSRN